LGTATIVALSGCAGGGGDADGPTEITFSYLWGGNDERRIPMHVKHNMRRRVLVAGALGTATIVALSGCAGGGGDADGPTEITFSYLWGG
ncbi:hypothetical protein CTI14_64950, partial [Methylobacterium radiotolerans]